MSQAKPSAARALYQLKITLRDSHPPIWRRICVASDITLAQLHRILQVVMGWTDSHLHQFIAHGVSYGTPHPGVDFGLKIRKEQHVTLDQVLSQVKGRCVYEYDFGDSWEHGIVLEAIVSPDAQAQSPVCLAGKRACPPEDCGGIPGYSMFLEAIQDPRRPDRDERLEWLGERFDPEAFDLDTINRELKQLK